MSSFLLISCQERQEINQAEDEALQEAGYSMQGVWKLEMQYAYENGIKTDSIAVDPEKQQVKIFTKSKYMWTHKSTDSLEWHVYGSYTFDGKQLVEQKEYASKSMTSHSTKVICDIKMNKQHYWQLFLDDDGTYFYAEKFSRIE